MPPLPTDWTHLCLLVLLLGMRHGLDADHLATIDGLTRLNQCRRLPLARFCGLLFSAGHGAVVLAVAVSVGALSARWVPPGWLQAGGAWISIAFLLLLGGLNLHAVLAAPAGQQVALVGVKGRLLGSRLLQARSPLGVAGVGALFALSFDTLSQAALFAAAALSLGGLAGAAELGALFAAGMLLTDGLNGWWISRLMARTDPAAARASRILGATVAGMSLLVAAAGLLRLLAAGAEGWIATRELALGAAVVVIVATGGLAAAAWERRLSTTRKAVERQAEAGPGRDGASPA